MNLTVLEIRVRVQLIRHFKPCTTDIFLHNECAHVGLSIHAPVDAGEGARTETEDARSEHEATEQLT